MTTAIAVLIFALLFVLFALLGPAERSRSCRGRKAGEGRCDQCPLGITTLDAPRACPGAKALEKKTSVWLARE